MEKEVDYISSFNLLRDVLCIERRVPFNTRLFVRKTIIFASNYILDEGIVKFISRF